MVVDQLSLALIEEAFVFEKNPLAEETLEHLEGSDHAETPVQIH
jgi:hypothetical protein